MKQSLLFYRKKNEIEKIEKFLRMVFNDDDDGDHDHHHRFPPTLFFPTYVIISNID